VHPGGDEEEDAAVRDAGRLDLGEERGEERRVRDGSRDVGDDDGDVAGPAAGEGVVQGRGPRGLADGAEDEVGRGAAGAGKSEA